MSDIYLSKKIKSNGSRKLPCGILDVMMIAFDTTRHSYIIYLRILNVSNEFIVDINLA